MSIIIQTVTGFFPNGRNIVKKKPTVCRAVGFFMLFKQRYQQYHEAEAGEECETYQQSRA